MAEKLDLEPLDLEPVEEGPKGQAKLDLEPLDLEPIDSSDPEDKVGLVESGLRGAGQGLTLGFMDEAAAGLQAGLDVATSDKKLSDLKQLYQTYKELQQERESQAAKQNPKTYMGAEIAGSLPTALLPGGQVQTAGKAAKLGAIYGLGKSEADLTKGEVGEASKDTLLGSILGYAGGKGGELVGKGLSKLGVGSPLKAAGGKLSQQGEDIALSTLGTNKRALEQEVGQSIFTPAEFRKGIGREILDTRGVFDSPGDLKGKLADKIKDIEGVKKPLLESSNTKLQQMIGESIETGESLATKLSSIKDKIVNREAQTATNIGSVKQLDDQLTETIKRYAGNDNDIVKLNEFKQLLGKKLSDPQWSKQASDLPQEAEYIKEAYSAVNKRIQELSDIADPGTGKLIKEMGQKENILYDSANLAKDAQIKELGRESKWGISDIIGSQLDKAKIGVAKGIDSYGKHLNKMGELVESPALSSAAVRPVLGSRDKEETKPLKLSEKLYSASDEEVTNVANVLEQNPQFSAYGKALKDAIANKSSEKKNAVLFTILQNPNMRKLMNPEE